MRLLPLLGLLLLFGGPTLAAAPPSSGELDRARTEVEAARTGHAQLRAEQLSLSKQVGALSQRITALKAEGRRGSAGELDTALKQSQALAGQLGEVSREESVARARLETAQTTLIGALNRAMVPLQRALETAKPSQRGPLIAQLQALRGESDRLRTALGPARLELLPPLPEIPSASAAPERLLARVDVLRDQETRVRARLKEVRQRLELARAEARMARGMDAFMGRRNLFDETDRRLSATARGGNNGSAEAPEFSADPEPGTDPLPETPSSGGDDALMLRSSATRGGAIDAAALAGRPHEPGPVGDGFSVGALEALERELEARARELAKQAAALEERL